MIRVPYGSIEQQVANQATERDDVVPDGPTWDPLVKSRGVVYEA